MSGALGEALQSLQRTGGLDMVAVVGADGLMLDAAHAPEIDAESLSALAASGFMLMDAMGYELEQGRARQAILEYEQRLVILMPLDEELMLVAVSHGDSNLGRIRLLLRRSLDEISAGVAAI